MRVQDRVVGHLLVRRQANHAVLAVGGLRDAAMELQDRLRLCCGDVGSAFRSVREDAVNPSMGAPGAASMPRTASRIGLGTPSRRRIRCRGNVRTIRYPLFTIRFRIRIDRRIERPRRVDVRGVDLGPAVGCRAARERGAAQIGDLVDALARREAVRDLADLPLGVAEHQQVGLRVHQHRAAHLLRPVVEVRDAAQRGLDAADDDRHVLVRLARALRVDDHAAIRPRPPATPCGV